MTYILTANCDFCAQWIKPNEIYVAITSKIFNTTYVDCRISLTDLSTYPADNEDCVHIGCLSPYIEQKRQGLG